MDPQGLILKLASPDRPGIVARIASYVVPATTATCSNSPSSPTARRTASSRGWRSTRADSTWQVDDFIAGFGTLGRALDAARYFRKMPYRMRTALLVTQTDHCLNEIVWRAGLGEIPVEITSVIGNRETCRGNAENAGLPFLHVPMEGAAKDDGFRRIRDLLASQRVELVVLARFMQILPDWLCAEYAGRVINITTASCPPRRRPPLPPGL
ncbi:MAG: formyltransferase family protein [Kiritimatiellia bacterium]